MDIPNAILMNLFQHKDVLQVTACLRDREGNLVFRSWGNKTPVEIWVLLLDMKCGPREWSPRKEKFFRLGEVYAPDYLYLGVVTPQEQFQIAFGGVFSEGVLAVFTEEPPKVAPVIAVVS